MYTYGGLDVHQDSIVAFLFSPDTGDCFWDEVRNDRKHLERAVKWWRKRGELRLCYEASSAGFVVKRWLGAMGIPCEVVAPAFIPKGLGDRIKTDRRDARRLAILYQGLVPQEYSSGERRRNGKITKVGNSHARWVLSEAARNQARPPGKSDRLAKQRRSQPPEVVAISLKAERRLYHKFWKVAVRKDRNTAAIAVAREMAGFVWALLTLEIA